MNTVFALPQSSFRRLLALQVFAGSRQSPCPRHPQKRTRSQGPSLHRRCPASAVLRPCPNPADTAAQGDVEAATLMPNGPPPITRTTLPTCRAHYPGGSNGCRCRLLPHSHGLPRYSGGSASASSLSRPAQTSLTLRWIAQPPKVAFVTRLRPDRLPDQAARQLPKQSTTLRVKSSSTSGSRLRGALHKS